MDILQEKKDKDVVVLFSGGIDCSLVSLLLRKDGYRVHLLHYDHGASISNGLHRIRFQELKNLMGEDKILLQELSHRGLFRKLALANIENDFAKYAGRLDKDSEGLLLLTNDGDLINGLMRAANYHEKEYLVRVNKPITDTFLQKMAEGVFLKELNVQTRPCQVEKEGKFVFRIVLTQGLNRQIRRMCRALGFDAQGIKRVRVANITIGKLKPGNYRLLTAEELDELYGQLNP